MLLYINKICQHSFDELKKYATNMVIASKGNKLTSLLAWNVVSFDYSGACEICLNSQSGPFIQCEHLVFWKEYIHVKMWILKEVPTDSLWQEEWINPLKALSDVVKPWGEYRLLHYILVKFFVLVINVIDINRVIFNQACFYLPLTLSIFF